MNDTDDEPVASSCASTFTWYTLNDDDETLGPFTLDELKSQYKEQQITDETFVWAEELMEDEWPRISQVDELRVLWDLCPP